MHHLYEHISHGHNFEKQSVVLCTNAYRLTDDGWRMVLHHGSPGSSQQSKAGPKPGGTGTSPRRLARADCLHCWIWLGCARGGRSNAEPQKASAGFSS